jgi:pyruvate ferredoxin oxidoreductase gamma subunit
MFAIRVHGRVGQGVPTAVDLLSVAAVLDSREALAYPGSDREQIGTPVLAYCRIADSPIRLGGPILTPDAVVVLDATLVPDIDLFAGLPHAGYVLVNSNKSFAMLGLEELRDRLVPGRAISLDASEIARDYRQPLPNICLLGALAAMTGIVTCGSIETAVHGRFIGSVADSNARAARAAFTMAKELAHAQ